MLRPATWRHAGLLAIAEVSCSISLIVTSAEEGGYVFGSVCLSVCLFICVSVCLFVCLSVGLLANLWTDFDEIFWRGRAWLKNQVVQFWWRSESRFGSGSPKAEIRILRIGGGLYSLSISSSNCHSWNTVAKKGRITLSQFNNFSNSNYAILW